MGEHPFDEHENSDIDDDRATERAAVLVERLLDEVARAGHSWSTIEELANALARVAKAMTRRA